MESVSRVKVRYEAIDYAKTILIVLMVVGHIAVFDGFEGFFGPFRMGAFLFIAGLFCKKKEVPAVRVLESSFYQLIVPYAFLSFISFVWCWVSPYLHPELYPGIHGFGAIFKAALIGGILGQDRVTEFSFMPNAPLWFLLGLFWCRIWAMVWIKSDKGSCHIGKVAIAIMCVFIYRLDIGWFSLRSAAVCFPFYIAGYYMKEVIFSFSKLRKDLAMLLALAAVVGIFLLDDYRLYYDAGKIQGLESYSWLHLNDLIGGVLG